MKYEDIHIGRQYRAAGRGDDWAGNPVVVSEETTMPIGKDGDWEECFLARSSDGWTLLLFPDELEEME